MNDGGLIGRPILRTLPVRYRPYREKLTTVQFFNKSPLSDFSQYLSFKCILSNNCYSRPLINIVRFSANNVVKWTLHHTMISHHITSSYIISYHALLNIHTLIPRFCIASIITSTLIRSLFIKRKMLRLRCFHHDHIIHGCSQTFVLGV